jgi:hypothetical protein
MKIQIDTTSKKISLEESVNFKELIDIVSKLLPDDLWKEFTLETHTVINWQSPIIIKEPYPIYPTYPVYPQPQPLTPYPYPTYPWITWGADQSNHIMSNVQG